MTPRPPARSFTRAAAVTAVCAGLVLGSSALAPAAFAAPAAGASTVAPDVVDLGVTDLLALLESGQTTSTALVQEYLDRMAAYDDPYGDQPGLAAIILANPDALATAATMDAERAAGQIRGPLHGVPILVKDNYATFDMPTTAGSSSLKTYQTKLDSTAVQRLRDAGAIILAKTNMSEFAWHGTYTLSSERGRTNNAYNQANSASGSSGGTGAAVAASFGPAGLGTDSCGSIVGPSAHESLVGYRPTMGLTSVTGIVPLSIRQDVSGPMTKTVTDAALLLNAIAGYDPADPQTEIAKVQEGTDYVAGLSDTALEGKRIGYVQYDYTADEQARPGFAEQIALFDQAVADLEAQGAEIVAVPDFTHEFVSGTLKSGGWTDMRSSINTFFATTEATWPEGLASLAEPTDALTFEDVIADGASSMTQGDIDYFLAGADIPNPAYDAAVAEQEAGKLAMDQYFVDHDLDALAMPTSAGSATPDWAGTTFCDVGANTGIPTVSLPAGFTSTGEAAGLELAAPRSHDADLLAMSYDYEQATLHRVAPASTPELDHAAAVDPEPTPTPAPTGAATPAPEAGAALAATGTGTGSAAVGALAGLLLLAGAATMVVTSLKRRRTS
ncbi:amidase family protein [Herbiconiux sp. YIM B11900]|uniref:amidase family protein n=1 Tax=Herbiconiux sp. YIM B11900 TaxID=3404131 RepID=UPI003F87DEAB